MKPKALPEHISGTYFTLRVGVAVLGFALPFVLSIGGYVGMGIPLQESMSAYYHANAGAMRDGFVGVLCAVGALLYLYKGYTRLENYALNMAGVFLALVALVPMQWGCGSSCSTFSWHGTFAVLFFLLIAYVCVFRASDTLGLLPETARARFGRAYKWLGSGMVASPVVAVILSAFLERGTGARATVFFIEALGVFVFGAYWVVKSRELSQSNAERSAIEGRLLTRQVESANPFRGVPVEQVSPSGE